MQFLSAETNQAFLRRVILPLAALVIGLLVFAVGGICWIADYQTLVAIEQQARLADGAFRIDADKLAISASDYGYWDDAVTAVVDRPDRSWMDANIGSGAQKSLGITMSFALDPDGEPVYSFVSGIGGKRSPADLLGDGFRRAFEAWKKYPAGETYSGLLPYNGTAVALAIAPVRSFTHSNIKPTGYSIVFVKIVDNELLQRLARDFELANFRVVRSDKDIDDELAVVRIDDGTEQQAVSRFAWDPQRPGSGLLRITLPFMALFLLILMLLAGVVLNYVITSAQIISDREKKASCDPLTGLANRSRFFSELELAMSRIFPGLSAVTVMYIDLDGFKTINDTMGHAAGDELLVQAAARFRSCVRESDLVARLGGDEFAIIISGKGEKSQTQATGARILLALSEPFHLAAGIAQAGCSIGVAVSWTRNTSCAALLNQADGALYQAKASGKNALRFCDEVNVARRDRMVA
ncbi:MAG: diguanylate cyclase [Rhizobium sp.]|nr:diguanylate cyclase [Rhizobium sp.]